MPLATTSPLTESETQLIINTLSTADDSSEYSDVAPELVDLYKPRLLRCLRIGLNKIDHTNPGQIVAVQDIKQEQKVIDFWQELTGVSVDQLQPVVQELLSLSRGEQKVLVDQFLTNGPIDFKVTTSLSELRNELREADEKLAQPLISFALDSEHGSAHALRTVHYASARSLRNLLQQSV